MALRHKAYARRVPVAALSILTLTSAVRAEVNYGVAAGVGESDNVTLVSSNKISQTIATLDTDFSVKESSRLLDVNAQGDFSYLDYLQSAYSSQLLGRFDGAASMAIVPEHLTWVLREDFGQSSLDPYTPVTPNNIENVNYLSTGPDAHLRLGASGFLDLNARYARAQYQTSPYDSNRALGQIGVGRDLSANSTVSLNGEFERVMFENTVVNTDFDRYSAYGRYDLKGARTDLAAELGATRISQTGESTDGVLAKLQLSRKISAASELTLSAGRSLTDAATSFSNLQIGPIARAGAASAVGTSNSGNVPTGIVGTAPPPLTSESYTSEYASAGWNYTHHRTMFSVKAAWEKDTYDNQPALDVKRPEVDVSVQRQLTSTLTARLLGRLTKTDYYNANVSAQDESSNYQNGLYGGSLSWRHGRGLEVVLRYDHNSWVVTGPGNGYNENRVVLTIGYRPSQAAQLQAE